MYIPNHFRVEDEEQLFGLIEQYRFGLLISNHGGRTEATHLPFLVDRENRCLLAHFAKANSQWRDIEGQEVLVVFQGPHHYISASWYETNQAVPTWDYATVHVYGKVERVKDKQQILANMNTMIAQYEAPESSYQIDQTNERFIDRMLGGIVPFRLKIEEMHGKWKMNQNHPKERRERVIAALEKIESENAQALARMMKEQLDEAK